MKTLFAVTLALVLVLATTLPAAYALEQPKVNLEFALNKATLNVYIVAKDSSQTQYIADAKNAVETWSTELKVRSGNPNAWNVKIFTMTGMPTAAQDAQNPVDILIEIKKASDNKCSAGAHTSIAARIIDGVLGKYTYSFVTTCNPLPYNWVRTSTMHEFGHTLGLAHSYNEPGDLMCGQEKFYFFVIRDTCPAGVDQYVDFRVLTGFAQDAVISIYGKDGFAAPNKYIGIGSNFKYVTPPGSGKVVQLQVSEQYHHTEQYYDTRTGQMIDNVVSNMTVSWKVHSTPMPGEPVMLQVYDQNTDKWFFAYEMGKIKPDGTFQKSYLIPQYRYCITSQNSGVSCNVDIVKVQATYGLVNYYATV